MNTHVYSCSICLLLCMRPLCCVRLFLNVSMVVLLLCLLRFCWLSFFYGLLNVSNAVPVLYVAVYGLSMVFELCLCVSIDVMLCF